MSKRLNRDHAKKTQRPMVEDEVIANQLEALLTPAITNMRKLLSSTKTARENTQFAFDGSCGVDITLENRSSLKIWLVFLCHFGA
jgi:hypothetical protein